MPIKRIFFLMLYIVSFGNLNAKRNSNKLKESSYNADPIFKDFKAESNTLGQNKKAICSQGKSPPVDLSEYSQCDKKVAETANMTHPHMHMRTTQLLEAYKYPYKEYKVKTKDGYILTLYRVTPRTMASADSPPVYMNHGLTTASDFWFFQPGTRNLVFKLSDEGYDVWLSNARGTSYSTEHETLNHETDIKYWDFSYHEMGVYDLPAVTNKIIAETGYKKIIYIGYSMGTTQIMISLSELPEMNDKILTAFLLAPIVHMGHCTNPLRYLAAVLETEQAYHVVNERLGGKIRSSDELRSLFKINKMDFCVVSAARCGLCDNGLFALHGFNYAQMNATAMPFIFSKMMDSASFKTMHHYGQFITSCKFQKYNYSPEKNLKLYGSLNAPEYKLGDITTPLHFYIGEQDNWSLAVDIHITLNSLSKGVVKTYYKVKDKMFTHLDFAMAKDADILLYNKVLNDIESYRYYYNSSYPKTETDTYRPSPSKSVSTKKPRKLTGSVDSPGPGNSRIQGSYLFQDFTKNFPMSTKLFPFSK